ncbi:MAG: ABC transporter ATP-binding protein, partial [Saprospiraceae bacterium]|nr:ABC transporter ATP-binding protein [Saprospiraceae bacterium]
AICGKPRILIADEPTTSLDVTTQKEILRLLKSLQRRLGMSCIFISHDPMVIAEITDEVIVMNKGRLIESGTTDEILSNPHETYTRSLLENSILPLNQDYDTTLRRKCILKITDLTKSYRLKRTTLFKSNVFINALSNISISFEKGSIHGIVGESGSGKSTLAKCVVGLEIPDYGELSYEGQCLFSDKIYVLDRKKIQMVFQDPYGSLNPRMKVGISINEVLKVHKRKISKTELKESALSLFRQVGLDESLVDRYPHQLSGGQRQRVAIARAIAVDPDILICDEAVSALDIPIQAQILQLLISLKDNYNLTIIFISHDLSVIRSISDRVTVLYKGRVEEEGAVNDIFNNPQSEYTQSLISSIPGNN